MMKFITYLACPLLVCCSLEDTDNQHEAKGSIEMENSGVMNDTTITYNIEGISTEGAEAVVQYTSGKISESVVNIYGERGQAKIHYVFLAEKISVNEKTYTYISDVSEVNSEEDIKLDKEVSYFMDFNGKPLSIDDSKKLDIYQEFRSIVPFEL